MKKITGIKSVDFKIEASGEGVVNWNGGFTVSSDGTNINNHSFPKLRGFTNIEKYVDRVNSTTGEVFKSAVFKDAQNIDFSKTPLYISQNCLRHYIFKNLVLNPQDVKDDASAKKQLCSLYGLIRGYTCTIKVVGSLKRKSALRLGDFVDQLGNGNFENLVRSGEKKSKVSKGDAADTSFYSRTTFGKTQYIGNGSINIEDLQFISLDNIFDRKAVGVSSEQEAIALADSITTYLKTLNSDLTPVATYNKSYIRVANILNEAEEGILLNDDAITILVDATLQLIKDLYITTRNGYMIVDNIVIDYNNAKAMRIRRDTSLTTSVKSEPFAIYYTGE
jgi:hypothetical protein